MPGRQALIPSVVAFGFADSDREADVRQRYGLLTLTTISFDVKRLCPSFHKFLKAHKRDRSLFGSGRYALLANEGSCLRPGDRKVKVITQKMIRTKILQGYGSN